MKLPVIGFFSNRIAGLVAVLSLLIFLVGASLFVIDASRGDQIGHAGRVVAIISVVFSFLLLAVIVEYLSRIAEALDKPGALGVDEDAGG